MPSFQFGNAQASNISALDGTSRSGAVFLGGVALIVANGLLTPAGRDIFAHLLIPRKDDKGKLTTGMPGVLLQVGLVLVLTLVASLNNGLGIVALAILVAMWLAWLIRVNPAHLLPGS